MAKVIDTLNEGTAQRILRAIIFEHIDEQTETFYRDPVKALEGYGIRAEQVLHQAFLAAYPHWSCSFPEYQAILHQIRPTRSTGNTLDQQ